MELETERDPALRQRLLRQLAAAETEVLNILRAERERLERENHNLEAALARIKHRRN
jgi:cell division protein FtsB